MKDTIYFNSYDDDVIKSSNQDYKLKDNYKWVHSNIIYIFFSYIVYYFVLLFSLIYTKLFLHVKIKNKKILKKQKGYFLYCNHTQVLGDVLDPFIITFPKHPFIICSPSNLGIKVIGKILPISGALPIPSKIHDLNRFKEAVKHYNKRKPIIIYPEAHLWPWYTKIREFNYSPFHFPVENNSKVFVATTTYKKRKYMKKPAITIYIDGPFEVNNNLSKKENIKKIHDEVYNIMVNRSKLSNYEYIKYIKKDE